MTKSMSHNRKIDQSVTIKISSPTYIHNLRESNSEKSSEAIHSTHAEEGVG